MPRANPLRKHAFPRFYACYLLKSIRTPRSTATYVGSTPDPPRRIRQHNGEITQGAWKTRHNRPWVMQMIVHGFPSKLAALQFEWAWQHPHRSRHLRFPNGNPIFAGHRGPQHVKNNILIARTMLSHHPYNLWPLHVKLFTEEAYKAWIAAVADSPLPQGLSHVKELEGVDGRSGKVGSGRSGPIDVTDSAFIAQYLPKHDTVPKSINCSLCRQKISDYTSTSLTSALCTSAGCTAVSHLQCLAADFLAQERSGSAILPRGGTCKSCNSYTLWGDIIRGCYRRHTGGAAVDLEDDDTDGEPEQEDLAHVQQESKKRTKAAVKSRSKPAASPDTKEEVFDLDGINSDSSGSMRTPLKRAKRPAAQGKGKAHAPQTSETEGEFFDLDGISSDSEPAPKRVQRSKKPKSTAKPPVVVATEGEFFDLDGINSDSSTPVEKPKSRTTGLARTLSQLSISSPASGIIDISD